MNGNQILEFAQKYAEAWCSQNPDKVAEFFAEDGSLKVNNNEPAVGREAISRVAESFMTAFPDMKVAMDVLIPSDIGTEFHWTLTGTNTGPNGTGNKVKICGVERWKFDNDGLIKESIGSFDADEYERQLKYGVED